MLGTIPGVVRNGRERRRMEIKEIRLPIEIVGSLKPNKRPLMRWKGRNGNEKRMKRSNPNGNIDQR